MSNYFIHNINYSNHNNIYNTKDNIFNINTFDYSKNNNIHNTNHTIFHSKNIYNTNNNTCWKSFGLSLAVRPHNIEFSCYARPNNLAATPYNVGSSCHARLNNCLQQIQRSQPQFLTKNTAEERPPRLKIFFYIC